MRKVKDKERILKAAREKQLITYRELPKDCQLISQQKLCRLEGIGKKYFKQGPTAKIALHSRKGQKKIHIYQQLNLINKLRKQEQRQNHGYRECFNGCHLGEGCGGMGEEVKGLRSTNR